MKIPGGVTVTVIIVVGAAYNGVFLSLGENEGSNKTGPFSHTRMVLWFQL